MTIVALVVLAGVVLLLSGLRSRASQGGSGAYRLLLGPGLLLLGVLTLPFVLLSRVFFALGITVLLVGSLGAAIARRR